MGAIASKQTFDTQKESNSESDLAENVTPKSTRTLPFDPRSPSGNVSRTPITVSDKADENGTPAMKLLKNLTIDPRSPTIELTRTPLLVEEPNEKRKYQPLKPSKLAEISFKSSSTTENSKDPRSPTEKVPRTPLEEESDLKSPLSPRDSNSDQSQSNGGEIVKDAKINLSKKLFDSLDKDRRPLTDVQNKTSSQPKTQLQALHCRNVEEEFARNEKQLLTKIESRETDVKTSTEFVENI